MRKKILINKLSKSMNKLNKSTDTNKEKFKKKQLKYFITSLQKMYY